MSADPIIDHYCIGASPDCFAVKRATMEIPNLFSAELRDYYMMADFSLKMEKRGFKTLICPWGQWRATGERSRRDNGQQLFRALWGDIIKRHGLRNPNLKKAPGDNWTLIIE